MRTQAVRAGLLAIVVTLFAVAPAVAQEGPSTPATEGIQVHGHWIIEVYEDGKLVKREDFKNALSPPAPALLSNLLTSEASSGNWNIGVETCGIQNQVERSCSLEATAQSPTSGDNADAVVLTASTTIFDDGSIPGATLEIRSVGTGLGACDSSVPPAECDNQPSSSQGFTNKTLASPIAVEDGQEVNVTVIISFTG